LPLGTLPQHPNRWAHALMRTGLAAVNLKSPAEIASVLGVCIAWPDLV
jgi:hypothetical protein